MKLKSCFFAFFLFSCFCRGQILINEVSSANDSILKDQDDKYPDWIELYNAGTTAVNLENYSLTNRDQKTNITWIFPKAFIQPKKHLSVFASGKDRKLILDHWEVPVYAANPWKYFVGLSEPPSAWRTLSFNDGSWQTGAGPIGYNYGGLASTIPSTRSLYMRKSFFVTDTSRIVIAVLYLVIDDGFVAYLNDVEIARVNLGTYGDHPAYNTFAYDPFPATQPLFFLIPKNVLIQGQNIFTIQTHNAQIAMNNLLCNANILLGVTDTTELLPSIPIGDKAQLHTNFTLPSKGEKLILKNPAGTVIDEKPILPMQVNHSFGRSPDGGSNWCFFNTPSPTDSNSYSVCYSGYSSPPVLSLKPGFYNGQKSISISSNPSSVNIRYTTDGGVPTATSSLYSGAIVIDSSRVVKARNFAGGNLLPSETTVGTYFINENFSFPVLSVSANPKDLWDWNTGIYVKGPEADTVWPYLGANFWKGWSRIGHVEYFDKDGKPGFDLNCALEIQGNYSKGFPQKGFSVSAEDDYGEPAIDYPIFSSKKHIKQYKSFNIRNAGSDWNTCHLRDRFTHTLVNKLNIDYMAGDPCIMFLNGQYWGVYELREKQDGDYIEDNHGVSKKDIDLLKFNGDVMEGSNTEFLNMVSFFETNSMTTQKNYDSARAMIDIENYCDYNITETYVANIDWIYPNEGYANNIKFWRNNTGTRKWRYVLWDTDVSLGLIYAAGNYNTNLLSEVISPPVPNPHSTILSGLLKNTAFKNYFVNRYADLLNATFLPSNFTTTLYNIRNELEPEMTRHFSKWNTPVGFMGFSLGSSTNVASWKKAVDSIALFGNKRPDIVRNHIQAEFGLLKQVNVSLNTFPNEAGKIKMNTIYPDAFPWTGVYFDGVPVTMTALSKPGYRFLYWRSNKHTTESADPSLTVNVTQADEFTAYFELLDYGLSAYPNPFTDEIKLTYQLPDKQQVSLKLYSVLGQEIAALVADNATSAEGRHEIKLDPRAYTLSPGIYFVRFKAPDFTKTLKIIMTK